MKKTIAIILLLILSLSLMSFSDTNTKPKILDINPASTLKQYVGDYEVGETKLRAYTKENDANLYLFISRNQPEFELSATGAHKFSFELSGIEFRVEFENAENGVFKELIFIQPDGAFKATRK